MPPSPPSLPGEASPPPLPDQPQVRAAILPELIDMLDDAVVVTSADLAAPGPIIQYVNAGFERMTGYAAAEAVGRSPRFLQGQDTDRQELERMRRELLATGKFEGRIVNYAKNGRPFLIEWRIKALRDDRGEVTAWLSVQRDTTEQVRAAHDQRRLAREVDHRAKNALALVQGIVRLSRADRPDDYAEAVQGRVGALACAHTLLSEGQWRGVPIKRLLDAESATFHCSDRVKCSGPNVTLPAWLVQPVSLLLHELMSNAVRHGALSTPSGELAIDIDTKTDDSIAIGWRERGGPATAEPPLRGFGLSMIQSIAARQLGGRVSLDWGAEGLEARLTVPLRKGRRP